MIDLGLAKRYKEPKTGKHIAAKNNKSLTGTARYASMNAQIGWEQSRRDDLESIAIMCIYFMKGAVPWQGLHGYKNEKEKSRMIKKLKVDTTPEELCSGLPDQFLQFLKYSRGIKFDEEPDYKFIRKLFSKCLFERG